MGPVIRPLGAVDWPALETFFRAGGDPRWCWCQYWRLRARDFAALSVPALRERLRTQAAAAAPDELPDAAPAASSLAPGLVAVEGDRVVGWVSLGPRTTFERIERSRVIPRVDARPVWSIVCFAVAPDRRGDGIGGALLDAAIDFARAQGAEALEAYPIDVGEATTIAPDAAFSGTVAMFSRAGFSVVAPTGSRSGGVPRVVTRREL